MHSPFLQLGSAAWLVSRAQGEAVSSPDRYPLISQWVSWRSHQWHEGWEWSLPLWSPKLGPDSLLLSESWRRQMAAHLSCSPWRENLLWDSAQMPRQQEGFHPSSCYTNQWLAQAPVPEWHLNDAVDLIKSVAKDHCFHVRCVFTT